jgi:hypothetical protein
MFLQEFQALRPQIKGSENTKTIHLGGRCRANAVKPLHLEGFNESWRHRGRDDKQTIGLAVLRSNLREEFVVGPDPVYDLACLSVYYPGMRLREGELLGAGGITDANAAVRLRLYVQLFDSLNRLWEMAEALRQASPQL